MSGTKGGGSSEKNSFEERLAVARRRQGLDTPPPPPGGGPKGDNALGVGLRVGTEMVAALVVAVAIGWALDRWLHTKPFMLILFVLLGGAAGVANVWRLIAPPTPPKGGT
jgi:ATP synthase protein I